MPAAPPPPSQVWQAIETYLKLAYDGAPPLEVRSRLDALREARDVKSFYESPIFQRDLHTPPTRYTLRLGNRWYPHMKLSLDLSPDDKEFLLRADTHDRHVCPAPKSPDYAAYCEMMEKNQGLAEAIDAAWAQQGLRTFKTYLREDLARRTAKG